MDAHHANSLTKKDYLILAALFLAALGIRLYFLQFFRVISADGVGYVSAARSIMRGEGFQSATMYGVIYPLFTALTSTLVNDFELAGRLVSMIMGSLIVVPIYLLGAEFFSKKVGLLACCLAIVWPSIRMWSGEVMTQATYMTILLTGIYLIWRAARIRSLKLSALGGMGMALAFLTRPEAFIVVVLLTLVLLLRGYLEKEPLPQVLLMALVVWGGFCCFFIPYLVLIHSLTGQWQLAGKTGVTLAGALSEYLGRPDMNREPGFQALGFIDVLRIYPDFVWNNFLKNGAETLRTMLPPYLWVVAGLGFFAGGWNRDKLVERVFLLTTFAPLLIIVVFFFVGPEYLQPYLPVLFLWTGQGLNLCEGTAARLLFVKRHPAAARRFTAWSPALIGVLMFAGWMLVEQIPTDRNVPYHYSQDGGRFDHKRIGQLLKQQLPPDSRIMTRWGRISFYAELERVEIPQASLEEIIASARKNRVRFIVVDGMLQGVRPQLGNLFQPLITGADGVFYRAEGNDGYWPLPGVRLYLLYKDPSSLGVVVYELKG
jgi:4-amino-4-deoxy-L-arabinose transferase-like glycosyltransferase